MTRLSTPMTLVFELVVNDDRDTVDLIESIARVLDVAIGEQEEAVEYVQLRHVIREPKSKEAPNV